MSGFDNIEKAMKQQVEKAYRQRASDMQATFDRLSRELKGQSLEAAKSRLQREWRSAGGTLTDPELTDYATALIEGRRIVLDVQPIRW